MTFDEVKGLDGQTQYFVRQVTGYREMSPFGRIYTKIKRLFDRKPNNPKETT